MRHAANESLAGWSTHQLQLHSWPLQTNIESGLRKGRAASPMFAYCGLAWLLIFTLLPDNPFPKTGKGTRTKQKAGNDGRKMGKQDISEK